MKRVLVVGATSAIATAVTRRLAARGARMHLVARSVDRLGALAAELRALGAESVAYTVLDLTDVDRIPAVIHAAAASMGGVDISLVCHGAIPNAMETRTSPKAVQEAVTVNFTSFAVALEALAVEHEKTPSSTIVVLGSVAGDRGRASNYLYGATKGGLETLTEGLRHRLAPYKVNVVLVKPGLIATPLTAHMKVTKIFSLPEIIAPAIERAALRGSPAVIYVPWWWRWIMFGVRHLPRALFHRTKF